MNTILYTFLLVCTVFLGGCCRTIQDPEELAKEKESHRQIPEVEIQDNEAHKQTTEALSRGKKQPLMIQIQKLSLTDKTLTLDYRLSNPSKDDVWICFDTSVYGKQDVKHAATRINGETVRIQLRCNIERFSGFEDPLPVAKYIRLQPGDFCTGRIIRDLPIKDYMREWREDRKEHKKITLHRAIFEVGYFELGWNKYFDSLFEEIKEKTIKPKPKVYSSYYYLSDNPLVTEESLEGQLREVMYLNDSITPWIRHEVSAEVVITNVTIPCSVVVDDK